MWRCGVPCSAGVPQQMSRSEQLLRERMRATGSGVTWYDYRPEDDLLVAQDGPRCVAVQRKSVSCLQCRGLEWCSGYPTHRRSWWPCSRSAWGLWTTSCARSALAWLPVCWMETCGYWTPALGRHTSSHTLLVWGQSGGWGGGAGAALQTYHLCSPPSASRQDSQLSAGHPSFIIQVCAISPSPVIGAPGPAPAPPHDRCTLILVGGV